MSRRPIDIQNLSVRVHHLWAEQWLVLSSGDYAKADYNAMAVGWGSLGTMWGRPFAQVVVRPSRYTRQFMERYETFTLCAFPARYHDAVNLLGVKSGRDGDKIKASGLTPEAASVVGAPCFAEAELVIECRKLYWQDIDANHFLDAAIQKNYPLKDYHRVYFGEIVSVTGSDRFRCDVPVAIQ